LSQEETILPFRRTTYRRDDVSEEHSLAGVLRCIKSSLELSVIDQVKYGALLLTTSSNLAEIMLKGFLINEKIKAIPSSLSNTQREQEIETARNSYKNRNFHTIIDKDIATLPSFSSKDEFLQICKVLKTVRTTYRNEYTHGFYVYRADIPTETIRQTAERFIRFLEILGANWAELGHELTERRDLRILTYYCSFERKNSEHRWRKFNENIHVNSLNFGQYLGEEFDGVRRLLALFELGITNENEFCSVIMGYEPQLCSAIIPILLTDRGQTSRQVQTKLRSNGNPVDLRKLENILDDLANNGRVQKRYENGHSVFLKVT